MWFDDPIGRSKEINTLNFTPFPFCNLPGLPIGWTQPEARKHEVHSWNPCRSTFLSIKESRKGRELVCGSQRKPSRKCNVNPNFLLYISTILSSWHFVPYLRNTKETWHIQPPKQIVGTNLKWKRKLGMPEVKLMVFHLPPFTWMNTLFIFKHTYRLICFYYLLNLW